MPPIGDLSSVCPRLRHGNNQRDVAKIDHGNTLKSLLRNFMILYCLHYLLRQLRFDQDSCRYNLKGETYRS